MPARDEIRCSYTYVLVVWIPRSDGQLCKRLEV